MRLAYTEKGSESSLPLVLIHAFPLNRSMWRIQLEGLSDKFRVIAPDLPGFGESPVLTETPSVESYVRALEEFLDEMKIERAVFGGCSMGGYLLFELWRQNPHRVLGLILCDTRAEPDSDEARNKRAQTIKNIKANGVDALVDGMLSSLLGKHSYEKREDLKEEVRAMIESCKPEGVVHALLMLASRPDSRETLGTITKPVLVAVGEEDTLTPPDLAKAMHEGIPDCQLLVIPKAGHLSPFEQPDVTNQAWRAFLEKEG